MSRYRDKDIVRKCVNCGWRLWVAYYFNRGNTSDTCNDCILRGRRP